MNRSIKIIRVLFKNLYIKFKFRIVDLVLKFVDHLESRESGLSKFDFLN